MHDVDGRGRLVQVHLRDQVLSGVGSEAFPLRLSDAEVESLDDKGVRVGDHLAVIDATVDYFECLVTSFDRGVVQVRIAQHVVVEEEAQIVLLQAVAQPEVMARVVSQAAEVGVAAVVPVLTERSNNPTYDNDEELRLLDEWRAIAADSAAQAGRIQAPEVTSFVPLAQVPGIIQGATALLVCDEQGHATATFSEAVAKGCVECFCWEPRDARIAVAVGPEGGFTDDEFDLLTSVDRSFAVSLGQSVLRVETAALLAVAFAMRECGGLGTRMPNQADGSNRGRVL